MSLVLMLVRNSSIKGKMMWIRKGVRERCSIEISRHLGRVMYPSWYSNGYVKLVDCVFFFKAPFLIPPRRQILGGAREQIIKEVVVVLPGFARCGTLARYDTHGVIM
mmetsp:Transcript_25188/g.54274  ORF Transcript_25188/g.54274 Transcript_25188/m.54274 type:complete len:107 (-) Transcript_25188:31-351(-)